MNKPVVLLAFVLLLNALFHLPFINEPPRSRHVWRQTFTLSVARNFYREDMNILKPRVDNRGSTDGVTGMQFPLYEYGLACIYNVFGEHYWVNRLYAMLISSLGISFFFYWILTWTRNNIYAFSAAWMFTWAPEIFYHGFNALPDILSLSATAAALLFAFKFRKESRSLYIFLSMLFFLIAGLTKLQFLMSGVFWIFILLSRETKVKEKMAIVFSGVAVVSLTISWYLHAVHMIQSSGLNEVGLEFRPLQDYTEAWKTISHNIISDIPELLSGYASFIFIITGLVFFFRFNKFKDANIYFLISWFILFLVYYITELSQMDEHNYYLLPLLPLLIVAGTYGAGKIHQYKKWLFLLIIIAQPVLTAIRIIPSRWIGEDKEVPVEFMYDDMRKSLMSLSKPEDRIVVLGDKSNCIWFYFLERKGFSVHDKKDLNVDGKNSLSNLIFSNVTGIYSREKLENDVDLSSFKYEIAQVGDFYFYKLK